MSLVGIGNAAQLGGPRSEQPSTGIPDHPAHTHETSAGDEAVVVDEQPFTAGGEMSFTRHWALSRESRSSGLGEGERDATYVVPRGHDSHPSLDFERV